MNNVRILAIVTTTYKKMFNWAEENSQITGKRDWHCTEKGAYQKVDVYLKTRDGRELNTVVRFLLQPDSNEKEYL
jgi:hypothetical protein